MRSSFRRSATHVTRRRALFGRLEGEGVAPAADTLDDLERWFYESVRSEHAMGEFVSSLEAGAGVHAGVPFLARLFARFTTALRTNVTYKDELRRVVRNSYSQFADAFNRAIRGAEAAARDRGLARRFLFVVDGTDKLGGSDTAAFFHRDVEQLQAIRAHVVYTAHVALQYEGRLVGGLDADLVLPMIRLTEPDGTPFAEGVATMRAILLARADRALFASDAEIERLVAMSGGHPRELLRLLKLCCEFAEGDTIDADATEHAVRELASTFRRFLEPEDYDRLAGIDAGLPHTGNDATTRKLLYTIALLEYNDGSWRRSHPVVRTLEGYRNAVTRRPMGGARERAAE